MLSDVGESHLATRIQGKLPAELKCTIFQTEQYFMSKQPDKPAEQPSRAISPRQRRSESSDVSSLSFAGELVPEGTIEKPTLSVNNVPPNNARFALISQPLHSPLYLPPPPHVARQSAELAAMASRMKRLEDTLKDTLKVLSIVVSQRSPDLKRVMKRPNFSRVPPTLPTGPSNVRTFDRSGGASSSPQPSNSVTAFTTAVSAPPPPITSSTINLADSDSVKGSETSSTRIRREGEILDQILNGDTVSVHSISSVSFGFLDHFLLDSSAPPSEVSPPSPVSSQNLDGCDELELLIGYHPPAAVCICLSMRASLIL